jgi:hypothetical protein
MTRKLVATQAEWDAAVAAGHEVEVRSGGWVAYGSATVRAADSATVRASDSATVRASAAVPVLVFSTAVDATGGVQIDHTPTTNIGTWADRHGAVVLAEELVVYKAVDDNLASGRGFLYPIGETVECDDWDPADRCGNGLHFSPWPFMAQRYHETATRWLRCAVPVDEAVVIDDKVKAPCCRVLCEVDIDGVEVAS